MSDVRERAWTLEGMHCGACVRRARAALEKVEGIRIVDLDVGRARIEAPSTAEPRIAKALAAAGFPAQPAP